MPIAVMDMLLQYLSRVSGFSFEDSALFREDLDEDLRRSGRKKIQKEGEKSIVINGGLVFRYHSTPVVKRLRENFRGILKIV
jgi:hypothetical protein